MLDDHPATVVEGQIVRLDYAVEGFLALLSRLNFPSQLPHLISLIQSLQDTQDVSYVGIQAALAEINKVEDFLVGISAKLVYDSAITEQILYELHYREKAGGQSSTASG